MVLPPINPMPVVRLSEAFDYEDFIFELKRDGFRGASRTSTAIAK